LRIHFVIFKYIYIYIVLGRTKRMSRNWFKSAVATWELQEDGRYACPYGCGRTYKRKGGAAQHLKYECGVEPKFKCVVCDKKFSHKSQMKGHMISIHKTLPLSTWSSRLMWVICRYLYCMYYIMYIQIMD